MVDAPRARFDAQQVKGFENHARQSLRGRRAQESDRDMQAVRSNPAHRSKLGSVGGAQRDVAVLRDQNRQLEAEAARLQSPEEIERIARGQFNMVYPGEQAYKVLPAAGPSTTTTVP